MFRVTIHDNVINVLDPIIIMMKHIVAVMVATKRWMSWCQHAAATHPPPTQWPAVNTHWGAMTLAPQKNFSSEPPCREAIQGQVPGVTSSPPTTRSRLSWCAGRVPHTATKIRMVDHSTRSTAVTARLTLRPASQPATPFYTSVLFVSLTFRMIIAVTITSLKLQQPLETEKSANMSPVFDTSISE